MFDIGFTELLFVGVVALVVLGPDKLPAAVKTLGMWLGRIKRTVTSIQTEISEELRIEEMKRTTAIQKEELEKELQEMTQPFSETIGGESPMAASTPSVEELQKQNAKSNDTEADISAADQSKADKS